MPKKLFLVFLTLIFITALLSGCDKVQNLIVRQEASSESAAEVRRESFLEVYNELEKEIKKKAEDALFTGAIMMKPASEPWDGKSSVWSAGFYSQKNNKAYIVVWDKGSIKITKETVPDKDIKDKVITGNVAVDSTDALEIGRATMITQVDSSKADKFKSLLLAYSNSLRKHVWAVSFEGDHRILIDAITGEVLEAK